MSVDFDQILGKQRYTRRQAGWLTLGTLAFLSGCGNSPQVMAENRSQKRGTLGIVEDRNPSNQQVSRFLWNFPDIIENPGTGQVAVVINSRLLTTDPNYTRIIPIYHPQTRQALFGVALAFKQTNTGFSEISSLFFPCEREPRRVTEYALPPLDTNTPHAINVSMEDFDFIDCKMDNQKASLISNKYFPNVDTSLCITK